MSRGEVGHGFLDTRQQLAISLDELRADFFHLAPQRLMMKLRRDLHYRTLQSDYVGTAAVAMGLDQLQLGLAHRSFDRLAMTLDPERRDRLDEGLERLQEVDVGIPQRIVSIEDQIQRRLGAPIGRSRHRNSIVATARESSKSA